MKTSSCKAKGRKLQKIVAEKISEATGLPCGKDKSIESRPMGSSGTDVRLDKEALALFKYSVECKNAENWAIPSWIQQAKDNQMEGTDWLLVVSKNRTEPIVVMDMDAFFNLIKSLNEKT